MKGSTAQVIIKTLQGKRLKGMLAQLAAAPKGELLVEICQYMHRTDEITEADMRAKFNLSQGMYFHWIEVIGNHLAVYLGAKKDEAQMEHTFQLAAELVQETESDAATDVIRAGIKAAAQLELYDLVVRYWELAQTITPPPKIEGVDQYQARAFRSNIIAYSDLLAQLEKVAQERNATERKVAVAAILKNEIISSPDNARSSRAAYYYWRIRSFAHALLREYSKAIEAQDAILAEIRANPWMCSDIEYSTAKETKILLQHLRLDKQDGRFREVSADFHKMVFKSAHAEQERIFLRFPASIALAIQLGDSEEVLHGISSFLTILENGSATFTPTFITENLYCCLYGAIALRNNELWNRIFHRLGGFGKPDFKLKFYPMSRFLEIIHTLETFEWEDALRKIKNLRSSNGLEEMQGMREVLAYLSAAISKWSQEAAESVFKLHPHSSRELMEIIRGTDLVDYFDLPAWLEAIGRGCPMMEIFHHRTISQ